MISLRALLEQDKPKYTLFVDMDGVLVDFDKGYKDLTGVATHHADAQGRDEFWNLYRNKSRTKKYT
jgi:hypothetical protein